MEDAVLFLHLVGVAVLVASVTATLLTLLRVQTSGSVAELRSLIAGTRWVEVFIIPAILVLIASGLYLVAQHGYHGSIPWSAGWVVTSMVVTGIVTVLGPTVEASDDKRMRAAVAGAPGEQPDADVRAVQLAPRPIYVVFFGTSQVVALLFMMTTRPGGVVSVAACVVAAAASAVAASVRMRAVRRARSDDPTGLPGHNI